MCEVCNVPETNIYMVYQCTQIIEVKDFFLRLLQYCGPIELNVTQMILLDIPKVEKLCKNTAILITALYISCIWYGRANKASILNLLKFNILKQQHLLEIKLKDKFNYIFTETFISLNEQTIKQI